MNFIQLANAVGNALDSNDTAMVQALMTPIGDALNQAANVQSNIGAMQDTLTAQSSNIQNDNLNIQTQVSNIDDTNFASATTEMDAAQTSLQALLQSSGQIFSESLLNFLSSSGA